MAIRPLVYYGHRALRQKALPVQSFDAETKELVQDLIDSLLCHPGWGLAAPQIGVGQRIFVTSIPDDLDADPPHPPVIKVWINPCIVEMGEERWVREEGCLSIPGIREEVERPYEVTVEAYDADGVLFRETASGWHAKVLFHENDHLNGVLFIDRIDKRRRKLIEKKLNQLKKKPPAV